HAAKHATAASASRLFCFFIYVLFWSFNRLPAGFLNSPTANSRHKVIKYSQNGGTQGMDSRKSASYMGLLRVFNRYTKICNFSLLSVAHWRQDRSNIR